MNKLIALLMCFQLILAPLSPAMADASSGTTVEKGPDGKPIVRDANGKVVNMPGAEGKVEGAGDYEQTGGDGGYDFYIKQVMMLAMSIVGSNLITQCPQALLKPSAVAYMAASITWIVSEMAMAESKTGKDKKELDKIEMDESKMAKTGTKTQKDALETRLQEEKDMKEFLEKKRDWLIAIEVMYGLAAGLAITEEIYSHVTATTAYTVPCTSGCTGPQAASTCIPACAATSGGAWSAEANFWSDQPDLAVRVGCATAMTFPTAAAACEGYWQHYKKLAYAGCSTLKIGKSKILNTILSMGIMMAWGMAVGQIKGGGAINTYGNIIWTLLGLFSSVTSTIAHALFNYPIPRAVIFGAHAALGGAVLGGTIERINKTQGNIEKLERVIASFKETEGEGHAVNNGPNTDSGQGPDNKTTNKSLTKLAKGKQATKSCIGNDRSVGPGSCGKPLKIGKPNFNFGDGLGNLSAGLGHAVDMANHGASGDLDKASSSGSSLAAMAASIKKTNAALKKKLNAHLKASGKPPIDFDKRVKTQLADLEKSFNQAAASKGMAGTSLAGAAARATLDADKADDKDDAKGALGETAAAAPAAAPADLGLEAEGEAEFTTPEQVAATGEGIDKFETTEADINKDSGVPIWTQLSNRYILNYNKIFNRKEQVTIPIDPGQAAPPAAPDSAKK